MAKTRTASQQEKHDKKVRLNLAHQRGIQGYGEYNSTARSKHKRKARRAELRVLLREVEKPKPVAPVITFFLDRMLCEVRNVLQMVKDEHDGKLRGINLPVVYTRTIRTKKTRVRGKWVHEEHFSKWREFKGAAPALERDQTTDHCTHIGIRAPITAWQSAGLLDGRVLQDLPSEPKRLPFVSTWKPAEKRAA